MTMERIDLADDSDDFEWVTTADGRRVQVLRDRGTFRVPMLRMNDSATGNRLSRPGFAVVSDSVRDQKEQMYLDYERSLQDAYLTPPGRTATPEPLSAMTGAGSPAFGGAMVGDICTVRGPEYPDDFGSPGTLQMRGGSLVCVPNKPTTRQTPLPEASTDKRTSSIDHAQADHSRVMDEIYSSVEQSLQNAWRTPS